MRKIISGLFISLDGVVEAPDKWHFPYFNDEMGAAVNAQAAEADTLLFGRVTYQEFASYWPDKGSEVPFSDHINNTPKLVASRTLDKVEWRNSSILRRQRRGRAQQAEAAAGPEHLDDRQRDARPVTASG